MPAKHEVSAADCTLTFVEDLTHCVTQAMSKADWRIVFLSPQKLSQLNDSNWGAPDWVKPARLAKVEDALKNGQDVFTPVYYSRSTGVFLPEAMDGRHRTLAAWRLGAKSIPVAVPASEVDAFQSNFS